MIKYKKVHIYMTLETLELLDKLKRKYKISRSEVIRNMVKKRTNLKTLKALEREWQSNKKAQLLVSRVPGNINQIAQKLNEGAFVFDEYKFYEMVEELKDEVKELTLELKINTMLLQHTY